MHAWFLPRLGISCSVGFKTRRTIELEAGTCPVHAYRRMGARRLDLRDSDFHDPGDGELRTELCTEIDGSAVIRGDDGVNGGISATREFNARQVGFF